MLVIHVDGGARGNPGPAAIGVVLARPDGTVLEEIAETIGIQTNNAAEYHAVLAALRRARELGETELRLIGDSELVARQLTGAYTVKQPALAELHAQALELLAGFASWSFDTVPRAQNAAADALVNRALNAA